MSNTYAYTHKHTRIHTRRHFVVNLHVYGSPFYLATTQSHSIMAIGRDNGLSTLCHSCRFTCQQRVLKTFPGSDYLYPEDGIYSISYIYEYSNSNI